MCRRRIIEITKPQTTWDWKGESTWAHEVQQHWIDSFGRQVGSTQFATGEPISTQIDSHKNQRLPTEKMS